jgi:hypothetical protein
MPLPFEKNNVRKWQCFVCGHNYTDFLEFKAHIKDNHEEGRDYVMCPVEHCQAPVRDLQLHFKARHASIHCPQQKRAIIFKDISSSGKLKTRKPEFYGGSMISLKNHGKEFKYKSRLECECLEILEVIDEIQAYGYEAIKEGIPYLFEGEPHRYHPDLLIYFTDGHVEMWEIKPSTQTDLPVNKAKWTAAQEYCMVRGWNFQVITEKGINKLKKAVKKVR